MAKSKRVFLAGAMAAVFAVSGQLAPKADIASPSAWGMQRAEAGIFDGLGDILKKEGKKAAEKALNVDIDSMQDRRQNMIVNLAKTAICYEQASIDVAEALGLDGGKVAQMKAALTQLKSDRTNMGSIKAAAESSKLDPKVVEEAANALAGSGDEGKIARANELLKKAKVERRAANVYKVMAARDASYIVKDAVKALAKSDSLGDQIGVVQDLSTVAKAGEAVCKVIGDSHKSMTKALKKYEASQNIKDVTDDEAKKDPAVQAMTEG